MRTITVVVGVLVTLVSASIGWASSISYLGNDTTSDFRNRTDGYFNGQSSVSNFLVLDLNPESEISSEGNIVEWRWYAKQWATNDSGQAMDLMVWRPIVSATTPSTPDTYQLILKQRVVSTTWKEQAAAVDNTAVGSTLIKPGDVLGYYVPIGQCPVLALDYQASSAGDYYWLNCGDVEVDATHTFTAGNGTRTYSLGALVAVPEPGSLVAAFAILSPAAALFRRKRVS